MKNIEINFIECEAAKGAMLYHAMLEALALAFSEQKNVVLIFNEKRYRIDIAKSEGEIPFEGFWGELMVLLCTGEREYTGPPTPNSARASLVASVNKFCGGNMSERLTPEQQREMRVRMGTEVQGVAESVSGYTQLPRDPDHWFTLAQQIAAAPIGQGKTVAFLDVENQLRGAIVEACTWLQQGAPGCALQTLENALKL